MTLTDGIYFDLPEDDYHAIQRLSTSAICKLRISPADFWADSWLNLSPAELTPDQLARQLKVRVLGRAYHCARLEPERFHDSFVREISKADFAGVEGFLDTSTAIGDKLAELGEPKSKAGEGVLDKARRLRDLGYLHPIWHIEFETWENDTGNRQAIPAELWDNLLVDMQRLQKVPQVHALLSGGQSEVSVLWTCDKTGIPMKARLDYLKPDCWADFKTFDNSRGKHVFNAIRDAFQHNRYYLQAVSYRDAVEAIRSGNLAVLGKFDENQMALVEQIRRRPSELDCVYVFQQKSGVPNIFMRRVNFWDVPLSTLANDPGASEEAVARAHEATRRPTALFNKGRREIAAAKRDFLAYQEIYAPGEEWLPYAPEGEFTDDDFPPWFLDEAI